MNPYLYLFRKYFNGYMIIGLILVICYFVRARNLYIMKHYRNIIEEEKKKEKIQNGRLKLKSNSQKKKSSSSARPKKSIKKKVKEGFVNPSTTKPNTRTDPSSSKSVIHYPNNHTRIQPCYETKLDNIYKSVHDKLDNDEQKMAQEYNKAYQEFIDKEKEKNLLINPLKVLTDFEDGIYELIDDIKVSSKGDSSKEPFIVNKYTSIGDHIPINKRLHTSVRDTFKDNLDDDDSDLIEGFATTKPHTNNTSTTTTKSNTKNVNKIDSLLSGDAISNILQFGLDTVNSGIDNYKFGSNGVSNFVTKGDNMMAIGILCIITSLLLYFADITS
jgi:hypothetical protein